ncbi:MAG: TVP38/TMEM64 family protein [Eggerthellaceae bacterium]
MTRNERSGKKREERRAELASDLEQREVRVFGVSVSAPVLIRAIGLIVILAVMVGVVFLCSKYFGDLFTAEGRANLVADVKSAGPAGALILLVLEIVQVVVAFIPGEVVQMVAGMMYGPWLGTAIIVLGCFLSMWFVYEMVHRLGQPFVESVVPTKYLESFRRFEQGGKLTAVVFVLFLIPGLPKDVFTYLVPLTSMPKKEYLGVAMIARLPGIFMSTHAASGLLNGNVVQSVIVFGILAVLGIAGIMFKDRIMDALHRHGNNR